MAHQTVGVTLPSASLAVLTAWKGDGLCVGKTRGNGGLSDRRLAPPPPGCCAALLS